MKKHLLITSIFLLGALVSHSQWEPDVRLTNDPASSSTTGFSNAHCIASSGDTVHVVWRDVRDGNNEIYYKRSLDGGLSWGADTRISNNIGFSSNPSISLSGKVVLVVWEDNMDGITAQNYQIFYNRSSDGGSSWGTDKRLSNDPNNAENPSVSSLGPLVLVVWNHRDASGLYTAINCKRSADGGLSWGEDIVLTNDPGAYWQPCVSISESEVHVVWLGGLVNNPKVGYKKSTDGGISWGVNTWLTSDNIYTDCPSVYASGSSVHVLWLDARPDNLKYQIYYKNSNDGGINWGPDTQLTTNFKLAALQCSMAVSGSDIHVVWPDNRDGNVEIYYIGSKDGGTTWRPETRLTNNASVSTFPFVSSTSKVVHVIWEDYRDGNMEIYYKRNPTNNEVGLTELPSSDLPFNVFPNPASTEIKVRSSENINELSITDISGKQIYYSGVLNPTPELRIPTSELPAGIYLIKVKEGNRVSIRKLIKL